MNKRNCLFLKYSRNVEKDHLDSKLCSPNEWLNIIAGVTVYHQNNPR